jgi:hypothetical protein
MYKHNTLAHTNNSDMFQHELLQTKQKCFKKFFCTVFHANNKNSIKCSYCGMCVFIYSFILLFILSCLISYVQGQCLHNSVESCCVQYCFCWDYFQLIHGKYYPKWLGIWTCISQLRMEVMIQWTTASMEN